VTVRFLADEDLRDSIIRGLRSREPALDILDVKSVAAGKSSPGLFVVPDQPSAIGDAIEWPLLVWTAFLSEEWRDQVVYVPTSADSRRTGQLAATRREAGSATQQSDTRNPGDAGTC
jgi:hypothetical protein